MNYEMVTDEQFKQYEEAKKNQRLPQIYTPIPVYHKPVRVLKQYNQILIKNAMSELKIKKPKKNKTNDQFFNYLGTLPKIQLDFLAHLVTTVGEKLAEQNRKLIRAEDKISFSSVRSIV